MQQPTVDIPPLSRRNSAPGEHPDPKTPVTRRTHTSTRKKRKRPCSTSILPSTPTAPTPSALSASARRCPAHSRRRTRPETSGLRSLATAKHSARAVRAAPPGRRSRPRPVSVQGRKIRRGNRRQEKLLDPCGHGPMRWPRRGEMGGRKGSSQTVSRRRRTITNCCEASQRARGILERILRSHRRMDPPEMEHRFSFISGRKWRGALPPDRAPSAYPAKANGYGLFSRLWRDRTGAAADRNKSWGFTLGINSGLGLVRGVVAGLECAALWVAGSAFCFVSVWQIMGSETDTDVH